MKFFVVWFLMLGAILSSAQDTKEPDWEQLKKFHYDSGFWLKYDHMTLTLMDYKVISPQEEWKQSLPEEHRKFAASSGLPKWVMIEECKVELIEKAKMQGDRDKHLIIGKVQRASTAPRAQRVFLFMGGESLVHGRKIVPIAMPDADGNFSFYPNGL